MVLLTECIPCQHGNHDKHYEVIQAVPEGMMGGARCPCKGECRDRPPPEQHYLDGLALPFEFPTPSEPEEA